MTESELKQILDTSFDLALKEIWEKILQTEIDEVPDLEENQEYKHFVVETACKKWLQNINLLKNVHCDVFAQQAKNFFYEMLERDAEPVIRQTVKDFIQKN